MKKLRYTLLASVCLLAAAVAAIGATTASAAVFTLTATACTGGTHFNLCYENAKGEKLYLEGTQSAWAVTEAGEPLFEVADTTLELLSQKAEAEEVTLSQSAFTANTNGTATSTGFDFTTNSIEGPTLIKATCQLSAAEQVLILTNALKAELISETLLKIEPAAGNEFVGLTLEQKAGAEECPALVIGKHAVTGFQNINIVEPGVAQAVKLGNAEELNLKFVGLGSGIEPTPSIELKFEAKNGTSKLEDNVYVSKES